MGNMPFPDKHRCCAGSSVGMEKWEWCLLLYNNPHFFFFKSPLLFCKSPWTWEQSVRLYHP